MGRPYDDVRSNRIRNQPTPTIGVDELIERFAAAVGGSHVHGPGSPVYESRRDEHGFFWGTPAEPLPLLVVQPATLDELKAVVAIAYETRTPIWTISLGRNFGYGGPAPVVSGSVTVDLQRVNRILEIDEEQAYAVVEPGVTPAMLWAEIERRGLDLWMDGGSSPYGSVIGNALERGIGYSLLADRYDSLCGLEVLLANGDLLRTGTGALPGSTTSHTYKYGYGPVLDGLFSQSNFGIVTKAGLWLTPRPKAFRRVDVYISDFEADGPAFIGKLADLRRRRVLETGVNGSGNYGGRVEGAAGPGGGRMPLPGEQPGYRARLGFHGSRSTIDARWQDTVESLSELETFSFYEESYDWPYDHSAWESEALLAAGIPSPLEVPSIRGVHSFVPASIVIPATRDAFAEFVGFARELASRFDQTFMPPAFHLHTPRALVVAVVAPLKGSPLAPGNGADVDNGRQAEFLRALLDEAATRGWVEYRTGTEFMDLALELQNFDGGSKARVNAALKEALDPRGILSPGKSGIWTP